VPTKVDIDDQEDDDDEEIFGKGEENKEEDPENANDDDRSSSEMARASNASQRGIKDLARKLWLAVEVGDKMSTLMILQ
jgi:hypothetical protein